MEKLHKIRKKPQTIPNFPDVTYKKCGWISYYDWLGTDDPRKINYMTFKEARTYVRKLNIKNYNEWRLFIKSKKRPLDIPKYPEKYYKNEGWESFADWTGNNFIATQKRTNLSFVEARKFVRSLKLKNVKEWRDFNKSGQRPSNIPANPDQVYKDKGWHSYVDFLGTENWTRKEGFMSFKEARKFSRTLGFTMKKEWVNFCNSKKFTKNIPKNPNKSYLSKGWVSWDDWLGKKS